MRGSARQASYERFHQNLLLYQNILSYWVPEDGDKPARVVLLKLTINKKGEVVFEQVTQKNLFRVVDIKMHWQSNGEFLCVKVDRYSKSSNDKKKVLLLPFAG